MKLIKKLFVAFLTLTLIAGSINLAFAIDEEITDTEDSTEESLGGTTSNDSGKTEEDEKTSAGSLSRLKYITAIDSLFDEEYSETEDIIIKLESLGILKDNDSFELDKRATRGEFAYIAANILSGGEKISETASEYEFKDVTSEHKYYNEIALLLNNNIIGGYSDGTYRPEEPILAKDALSIIVKTMGYEAMSDYFGGTYTGLMSVAGKLKLTGEAESDSEGYLIRNGMLKLASKALDTEISEISSITNKGVSYSSSGETVLSKYFDLICISGVVTANDRTSIFSKSGAIKENSVKIGDYVISFGDNFEAYKYLGLNCRVYCDKNDTDKGVYISVIQNKNALTKIQADKIVSYDSLKNTIKYEINDKGKTKTYSIPKSISVIFNGSAIDGTLTDDMLLPRVGELTLLDNDKDGKDDILFIDSFATYVSQYTGLEVSDAIFDKHGVQPQISIEKAEHTEFWKNDERALVGDISADDVMLVQADSVTFEEITVNGEKHKYMKIDEVNSRYYRIIVTSSVLSGSISNLNGDNEITVDNTKLEMSENYKTAVKIGKSPMAGLNINVGRDVKIGIDAYGTGAYIAEDAEAAKYGYLIDVKAFDAFGDAPTARIFSQDGEFITPDFAEKIELYKKWNENDDLNEATYYAKKVSSSDLLSMDGLWNTDGQFDSQLVKYILNVDGKIGKLFIAGRRTTDDYYRTNFPETSENVFEEVKDYSRSSAMYVTNGFGFEGLYGVGSTTIGFSVPEESAGAPDELYQILTTVPYSNGATVKDAVLYDLSRTGSLKAFVRKVPVTTVSNTGHTVSQYNSGSGVYPVKAVENTYDSAKDEMVVKITVVQKAGRDGTKDVTYTVTDSELLSNSNGADANGNIYRPETHEQKVTEVQPGDLIQIHVDSLGRIDGFKFAWKGIADLDISPQYGEYNFNGSTAGFPDEGMVQNGNLGGIVKYSHEGTLYIDTGRSDGRYRKLHSNYFSTTEGPYLYDTNDLTLKYVSTNSIRVGDYAYWNQYSQKPSNGIFIRRP